MDSLKSVCRVCLQCNPETNSFFDEVEYDVYLKLGNVFQKVTGVEVLESNEDKPTQLCKECTTRLISAYDFICAVEEAEQEIENYMRLESQSAEQLQQIKEEEPDAANIDATDIDTEDIEVLEEDFQPDEQEQTELNEVQEIIIDGEEQLESEHTKEIFLEEEIHSEEILVISKCQKPNSEKLKKYTVNYPTGSRLSKALSSRPIKCDSCERTFAKVETFERHMKTAHTFVDVNQISSQAQEVIISPNDKIIVCTHCPQTYKRRHKYVQHLLNSHSYSTDQLSPRDKELAETKQRHKRSDCPYCGENFSQGSLIIHIRRHTGENPYQCDQCDMAFPRRQDLVVHQRRHTGEKPHACTVCGKLFSRLNKLTRHMRIHTGERPYKCTECGRSFAQSNDLKIHMRRHTGEKPYKCNVCLEAFICGAALKTHRRHKDHHSPEDEFNDPFASWRVCKRKLITEEIEEEPAEKEV